VRFTTINNKLTKMETQLDTIMAENKELKTLVAERDSEILSLQSQLNVIEQYNCSWSVRIVGLPLTPEEETSADAVKNKVLTNVLLPILEGAVAAGDLAEVPTSADHVLERAHVLRAKEGAVKPIIARFYSQDLRALIFRHKKAFAPKHATGPLKDRYRFLIFEDLTSINFKKMRALAADDRVAACWSAGGQLRFRLADNPTIRRVASIFESNDKIIG
jgi:hypothetical protein